MNIICKKAGQKLKALARILNYVDTEKLRIVMNASIVSQFSYCLDLTFHDRPANRKTNKVHARPLRVAYGDSY